VTDLLCGCSCSGEPVLEPDDADGVNMRAARTVSIGIQHILLFNIKKRHKNVQDAPSSSDILYKARGGGGLACGAKGVIELTLPPSLAASLGG
jgi:hypothetical protein